MIDELDGQEDQSSLPIATGSCYDSPRSTEQLLLTVSPRSSLDELASALNAADWLLSRAKSIHHLSRQITIDWIERNGEFDIGDVHFSVGYNTVTKCANPRQAGLQLLDSLKGDFSGFLDVLVAQPFKAGAAKRILEKPVYGRLFHSRLASRLVNGVPERSLLRVNTKFSR